MKFSGSHHEPFSVELNGIYIRHFSRAVNFRTFSFQVGLEKPQEEDPAARPFSGPNNWPNEVPELREVGRRVVGEEVEGLKIFGPATKVRCII